MCDTVAVSAGTFPDVLPTFAAKRIPGTYRLVYLVLPPRSRGPGNARSVPFDSLLREPSMEFTLRER